MILSTLNCIAFSHLRKISKGTVFQGFARIANPCFLPHIVNNVSSLNAYNA